MAINTPGLFITGTNTEVGKTYVTARIARNLVQAGCRVGVYKPAASGARRENGRTVWDDPLTLWEAAGRPGRLDQVCPQCFAAPLAPHLAAEAEGKRLDAELLFTGIEPWMSGYDVVLVEGIGGLMSPLGDERYVADLARRFGYPLVVVAANTLGTINQTLQTLITAGVYRGGLSVAGVILNHPVGPQGDLSVASNRAQLIRHASVPVLAELGYCADQFDTAVDWRSLAAG